MYARNSTGVWGQGLTAWGRQGGRRNEPPLTFTAAIGAVPPEDRRETDATPRTGQSFYGEGRAKRANGRGRGRGWGSRQSIIVTASLLLLPSNDKAVRAHGAGGMAELWCRGRVKQINGYNDGVNGGRSTQTGGIRWREVSDI